VRTTRFCDSIQVPTDEQLKQIADLGYTGWAANLVGDGVPPGYLWTEGDVDRVLKHEYEFLPIATVRWSMDQTAEQLVEALVKVCGRIGIYGAAALDTEYQERGNPHLRLTVEGFNRRLHELDWWSDIYAGAGFHGDGQLWLPSWTANAGTIGAQPPAPAFGQAHQWAGNVELAGVTVDLSVSAGLPFARTL
jgi:hypothetical protein